MLLITGAAGFLARAVVRQVPSGWRMAALTRAGTRASASFDVSHESVDELIADLSSIDAILHLAARIPAARDAAPADLVPTNVDLVAKLVQAYPNATHVLASSVSVFGTPEYLPLSMDSSPCRPNAYGLSKLAAECWVRKSQKYAIIRFSSLIGVGMRPDSFIPVAVSAARNGCIRLIGSGERLQNYLDVNDAALMCLNAISSEKSIAALGIGEHSYSNRDVANLLVELTGASIVHVGEDSSPSYVYDLNDAVALGRPYIDLRSTLENMVRHA